ncbi:MAG: histidine phosphatase family protein [Smithella sp.]
MAKKLVMIRHGVLDTEYHGRFMGKTDVGLSAAGQKQAAALALPMDNLREAHFIVSPLRRTLETARLALAASGQSFDIDSNLREIDFGLWEEKTFAEISMTDPAGVDRWSNFDNDFVFPGGEAIQSFIGRVRTAAQRIARDPAQTVAVITHGGIIRFLICHYLGLDMRNYLLFDVQPASLSVITLYDGQGILNSLNNLCHLEGSLCG